jgi:hypothetical protein
MAFRFKIDEPIEKGFRRVGAEQIEKARRQLSANADPAAEVHEARKCMKRTRALLRLGRDGLGDAVYRAENAQLREIAQSLSSARDDHVMLETVVKLAAEAEGHMAPVIARLKEAILAHRSSGGGDTRSTIEAATAALERALRRFKRLHIEPDSFSTLELGLVRNYRKGLERRDVAYAENTDEAFHDWRKCVQAHWRHMALLTRAWPGMFEAQIAAARELSQILGDDHDLGVLRARMATFPAETLSADDTHDIEEFIKARQTALRQKARPHGEMIFSERPKAHGRRIAAIWQGAASRARDEAKPCEPVPEKRTRAKAPLHARG